MDARTGIHSESKSHSDETRKYAWKIIVKVRSSYFEHDYESRSPDDPRQPPFPLPRDRCTPLSSMILCSCSDTIFKWFSISLGSCFRASNCRCTFSNCCSRLNSVDTSCLIFSSFLVFTITGSDVETLESSSATVCSSCVNLALQDSGRSFLNSGLSFASISSTSSPFFCSVSSAFDMGRESDVPSCSALHTNSCVAEVVV